MADKFDDLHKTAAGIALRQAVLNAQNTANDAQNTANNAQNTANDAQNAINGLTPEYIKINESEEYESLELREVTQIYASKQNSTLSQGHHIAMGVDPEENDERWISVIDADTIYIFHSPNSQKTPQATTLKTGSSLDKLVLSSGVKLDENVDISELRAKTVYKDDGKNVLGSIPAVGVQCSKPNTYVRLLWTNSTESKIWWNSFKGVVNYLKYLKGLKSSSSNVIHPKFTVPVAIVYDTITVETEEEFDTAWRTAYVKELELIPKYYAYYSDVPSFSRGEWDSLNDDGWESYNLSRFVGSVAIEWPVWEDFNSIPEATVRDTFTFQVWLDSSSETKYNVEYVFIREHIGVEGDRTIKGFERVSRTIRLDIPEE